jgi:hypothetical protein
MVYFQHVYPSTRVPILNMFCNSRLTDIQELLPSSVPSRNLRLKHFPTAQQPPSGPGPPHYRGFTITLRHTRYDSSGRVLNPSHRPLPDNTQHSQQTDIHAPCGIRTRNPSKPAAADPRLRPRSHWNHIKTYRSIILPVVRECKMYI